MADANVLIAAYLRNSTIRRVILLSDIQLVVPEFIFEELERHLPELSKRAGLSKARSEELLERLRSRFVAIPEELVSSKLQTALDAMRDIDAKDAPYLAAALSVASEGIWSDDPHMKKQDLVPCYTTAELLDRLRKEGFSLR
ncbi:MAG TPA: PIN domain-containing protein [Thermoplasmata archaeon]|nr:PIN domain-containing protein [Thermoplasmata archaeon]